MAFAYRVRKLTPSERTQICLIAIAAALFSRLTQNAIDHEFSTALFRRDRFNAFRSRDARNRRLGFSDRRFTLRIRDLRA
jgi:hypothetical protein